MGYVLSQGWQQLSLGREHIPLDSESLETTLTVSEREKLAWVPKILEYCRTELGLDPGDSYTTFLDTGGRPISYVVTAAHPLALVPYRWSFPFVGAVSYKGYFDLEDARGEAARLAAAGFDTAVHPVGAYSTLGWFRDPVLSTMLENDLPELIDLIIHETTHRTVYFDDETSFNESLATYIAEQGTRRFLAAHDELRPLLEDYRSRRLEAAETEKLLIRLYRDLDALYRSDLPDARKLALKSAFFETASRAYGLIRDDPDGSLPASNTTVLSFARYHEFIPLLEALEAKFGGHPRHLTAYLLELERSGRPISELMDPETVLQGAVNPQTVTPGRVTPGRATPATIPPKAGAVTLGWLPRETTITVAALEARP